MKPSHSAKLALLFAGSLVSCAGTGELEDTSVGGTNIVAEALSANGVDATLSMQSEWSSGYCADVTLTNAGAAAVTNWTLVIALNSTLSNLWSANYTQSGTQLTVTPMSWNANIAPKASVSFGFCGTGTGRPSLTTLTVTGGSSTTTQYTLTIATSSNGSTSPAAGTYTYDAGTAVEVTATAASGYVFDSWSGAATGTTNPVTVTMDANKTLTASFSDGNTGDGKPSAGCGKSRTLQNGTITIQSGGTSRSYILKVPDNYDNTHPYRLIIAYHWMGGTAQDVAGSYNWYGLWPLANNSTIFVAPQGLSSGGTTGWPNTNGQDLAFTDAFLAQVENDLCIDTTRIFSNGFSYGAGMSYEIACARANVFRGVALYSGAQLSGCDGGTTPIAFFQAHGVNDQVLPISGARNLRDHFVSVNGCTPQNPTDPASGSGKHTCTSYQGCSAGHPLTWCAFDGDHNPSPRDSGQSTSWVPQMVWDFFKQF